MPFDVEYYHPRVKREIDAWPTGILAGIGRALYCFVKNQRIVIVHAFVKKDRRTPEHDLRIARKRMKELQSGSR